MWRLVECGSLIEGDIYLRIARGKLFVCRAESVAVGQLGYLPSVPSLS